MLVSLHDQQNTIKKTRLAAKVFITNQGESQEAIKHSDKRRTRIECKRKDICGFSLLIRRKNSQFHISKYILYSCSLITHQNFYQSNSAEYYEFKLRRDIALNPKITPKEIASRLNIYYRRIHMLYIPLYHTRERGREYIYREEAKSYK